jgi:electron transfer flavoprotein alpha subunit
MPGNILFFAEQRDGKLKNVAREVAATGRRLADQIGVELEGILIGGGALENLSQELAECGSDRVYLFEDATLEKYAASAYTSCIHRVAKDKETSCILIGASAMGKDLAPRLAGRLGSGMASDCTGIEFEGNDLIASRPVYAGKAFVRVKIKGTAPIATLRPKAFPISDQVVGKEGTVEKVEYNSSEEDLRDCVLDVGTESGGAIDLTEADIIVSGGRGVKTPENFSIIEELAGALGGVVGASRAVVDAGWRSHNDQVGQTGKVVNPTLYVACGISGAIQHLAGMRSSKYIVAINKDPDAPIFKVADYGIVGDLFEIVPKLTEEIRKLKD